MSAFPPTLPACTSGPVAAKVGNDLLVFAVTTGGNLMTTVWLGGGNRWVPIVLTGVGGITLAPNPVAVPRVVTDGTQVHACYADANKRLQNLCLLNGAWYWIPVTGAGGATAAPDAAGTPCPVLIGGVFSAVYRATDGHLWGVGALPGGQWKVVRYTGPGGLAPGAAGAAGDPSVLVTGTQCHIFYRDRTDGSVWDVFSLNGGATWDAIKLSGPASRTGAPVAVGEPAVTMYRDTVTVCYRSSDGTICRLGWDGTSWAARGLTGNPAAVGDPSVSVVLSDVALGLHLSICYLDKDGNLILADQHTYSVRTTSTAVDVISVLFAAFNLLAGGGTGLGLSGVASFGIKWSMRLGSGENQMDAFIDAAGPINFRNLMPLEMKTDLSCIRAFGPAGVYRTSSPVVGTPCVITPSPTDIHTFFRVQTGAIYDAVFHLEPGANSGTMVMAAI